MCQTKLNKHKKAPAKLAQHQAMTLILRRVDAFFIMSKKTFVLI